MDEVGVGRYGAISGRYYAMDRDTRWDRTKLAYDAMVYGDGLHAASAAEAVAEAYERGENDEFVLPTVVGGSPGGARQGRRRLHLLQLPPGPRAAAHAGVLRPRVRALRPRSPPAARRLRHHDRVQEGVPRPRRLPARAPHPRARRGARRARPASAAHRRDREVRPRDLLLQRRGGGGGARRAPHPRPQPARCADLRLQAGDVRLPGDRGAAGATRRRRVRLRHRQLRQRRHGRPHRHHPGRHRRRGGRGRLPGPDRRGGDQPGRRVPDHRRPRQLGQHAGAGRQRQHGPQHQPGALHRHAAVRTACACGAAASLPTSPPRCFTCWASRRPRR